MVFCILCWSLWVAAVVALVRGAREIVGRVRCRTGSKERAVWMWQGATRTLMLRRRDDSRKAVYLRSLARR